MHVTSNSFIIQLYPNVESISSYCLDYYYIIISHKWNQWYSALAFPFLCQILFPLKLVIAFFSPSTSFSNYHQFVTDSDGIIKPLSKRSSSLGNLLELYFPFEVVGRGVCFCFLTKSFSSCSLRLLNNCCVKKSLHHYPKNSFTSSQSWISCLQNHTLYFLMFALACWSKSSSSSRMYMLWDLPHRHSTCTFDWQLGGIRISTLEATAQLWKHRSLLTSKFAAEKWDLIVVRDPLLYD